MAEGEAAPVDNNAIATGDGEGQRRNNPNPIFSLLSKFTLFNLPPPKRAAPKPEAAEKPEAVVSEQPTGAVAEHEEEKTKAVVVRFPPARSELPSMKLEVEDCEQNTNPVVLWQVYAIGGFFVLRWVLARWNERRAKKRSPDDEPSPADE